MLTIVAVVVLLIAAIAFANRSGPSGEDGDPQADGSGSGGDTQPTAPTGVAPVEGEDAATGIPSGFAHTKQGAQSAAANYAVALGGDEMFNKERRHAIVEAISAPSAVARLQAGFDADYDKALKQKIGLTDQGQAPAGSTFVNRTVPVGSQVTAYDDKAATVTVWCTGLFGVAGGDSTKPVTASWFTMTFELAWVDSDWKVIKSSQKSGPTPISGDDRVSSAKEIGEAVEKFGGFTYAR